MTAAPLLEVLEESRSLGFLGPGAIDPQVRHAEGFADVLSRGVPDEPPSVQPSTIVDLGSGGGLPGLVLADRLPQVRVVLVESSAKRCAFLRQAVNRCGWDGRVEVLEERAETAGRRPELRHSVDAVVARSFGPPAVVAECGAPLLRVGGVLVVSEPPPGDAADGLLPGSGTSGSPNPPQEHADSERWPAAGLAELKLEILGERRDQFRYQLLRQVQLCPDRYPRRIGVPAKRPLF